MLHVQLLRLQMMVTNALYESVDSASGLRGGEKKAIACYASALCEQGDGKADMPLCQLIAQATSSRPDQGAASFSSTL